MITYMTDTLTVGLPGKELTKLSFPQESETVEDKLFASQRLDEEQIEGIVFAHCTFSNISFKQAKIERCKFLNCVFIDCYFRKTEVKNCSFTASKFVSCEFPKIKLHVVDFSYARFHGCALPYEQLEPFLPAYPNEKLDLVNRLAVAASAVGQKDDARQYRLASIDANEEHLRAAFLGDDKWYIDHYQGVRRLKAGVEYLVSRIDGFLWGHGERWLVVLRNIFILGLFVGPIGLHLLKDGLSGPNGTVPNTTDLLWLSVSTVIPMNGVSAVEPVTHLAKGFVIVESLGGLVLIAMLGALLFKRMAGR